MHILIKLGLIAGIFGSVFVAYIVNSITKSLDPIVLDEPYWGPGAQAKDDASIRPFKISVSDEVLLDLKNRLSKTRPITPALEDSKHHYGINSELTKEILQFWKDKYDWRKREKFLNQYPQYKTKIQGLDIHYIHVKPKVASNVRVLPLLLVHGWPGSVREFYEIIPMLTQPSEHNDFVFELIIPSLPGYGFSDAAAKQGLGAPQTAVIFKNLMQRLGFAKYYVQGGDWGSLIVTQMSIMYPTQILGMHSNMCFTQNPVSTIKLIIGSFLPSLVVDAEYEDLMYPLSEKFKMYLLEFGYFHLQATKPDTVGLGLNDSPLGMGAYILEKFIAWTDMEYKDRINGGLKDHYSYEGLLDNVMIYWITNSMTTSMRMYAESVNSKQHFMEDRYLVYVPSACARFRGEISYQPDFLLKDKFVNLVHSADYPRGGHFAAFQEPKLLSNDIWKAVSKMERNRQSNEKK